MPVAGVRRAALLVLACALSAAGVSRAAAAAPVALPGVGNGEPSVAASGHGEVYVVAPGGVGLYWRSLDGRRFQRRPDFDQGGAASGDTDVAVGPDDGWVYAVNLTHRTTNEVVVSGDRGQTWSAPQTVGGVSDRPWLTAGRQGVVYLTYHGMLASQAIVVFRSADHGAHWTPVGDPSVGDPQAAADAAVDTIVARPVLDRQQRLVVLYAAGTSLWVSVAPTTGQAWSLHRVASGVAGQYGFPALGIDAGGTLYATWAEQLGSAVQVRLSVSADGGNTWSLPATIGAGPESSGLLPGVAGGSPGHAVVAWYSADQALATSDGFGDPSTRWFATAARVLGSHVVSTYRLSVAPVRRGAICVGTCSGTTRDLLDFVSVSDDGHDRASVVWASDTGGALTTWYGRVP